MTKNKNGLLEIRDAQKMLLCVEEYEAIKEKRSKVFKTVKAFCEYRSHQNFMKVYHRYSVECIVYSGKRMGKCN